MAKKRKLTPAQRRARREDRNPLYAPSVTLAGHDLAQTARKLAGIEIAPQLAALKQQTQTVQQQGARLADRAGDYYDLLGNRNTDAQATAQAISDRLNNTLTDISADTKGAIGTIADTEQSRLQADADQRGDGLAGDAALQAAAEARAIAARAAESGQAYRSAGALQGSSAEQLMNQLAGAGQLQGAETQRELAARQQSQLGDIAAQRAGIKASRGGLIAKNIAELRQQGFENLVTQRGLQIDQSKIAQDAADSARQYALAVQRANETARHNQASENLAGAKFESAEAKDAYQRLHGLGPYKPTATPKESQASLNVKRGIGNAMTFYLDSLKDGRSVDWVEKKLQKRGMAPDVLLAARELADYGYITPATLKILRTAGVTNIPSSWRDRVNYGGHG